MRISKSHLSDITGIATRTLTKRLALLETTVGPHRATMYESKEALQLLFSPESGGGNYELERTRLTKAQANHEELRVSEKEGILIDADEVRELMIGKVMSVRAGLLSLPARIAPVVMSATTIREVEDFARTIINQVLNDFADGVTENQSGVDGGIQTASQPYSQ